jgi:hypothetical protein
MDPNAFLKWMVYAIVLFKVCFIVSVGANMWYMHAKNEHNGTVIKFKEMFERGYIILMGLLLIYIFYPHKDRMQYITREIKLLFYIFGIIMAFMQLHIMVTGKTV